MNGQFSLGEIKPSRYFIGIAVILGTLFSSIAPQNNTNWLSQLLQWQVQTVVPMCFCIIIHILISKLGPLKRLNPWLKLASSGCVAALFFSPIGLLADILIAGESIKSSIFIDCLDEFAAVGPPIIVCWIAINAPFQLGYQFKRSSSHESKSISSEKLKTQMPKTGFSSLLPDDLQGEIVYIKSELHYLLVTTTEGSALILYSLKHAIKELVQSNGMQVHRSYWVNNTHIQRLEKSGREGSLTLSNGATVPVSRKHLKQVANLLNSNA